MDLNDPNSAALLVAEAFERGSIAHALYGGLLLAAYGEPRETRDVDVAVVEVSGEDAASALEEVGLAALLEFEGHRFGGLLVDRLSITGDDAVLGLNTIDLVRPRSIRFARSALGRAVRAPLRGRDITVLAPEDFVIFKVLSTRDRDLDDAASVVRRTGEHIDLDLVRREVDMLGDEISDFDLRPRLEEILLRAR